MRQKNTAGGSDPDGDAFCTTQPKVNRIMVQALVYRAVRRRSPDLWKTRRVCASIPTVIVETLDAIARDTRRSRSAVITDVLRAHPDIAAALTALGVDDAG